MTPVLADAYRRRAVELDVQAWLEAVWNPPLDLRVIVDPGATTSIGARSGVGADRHGAHRQGRLGLHDRAHQFDLVVELAALGRGQRP